MSVRIEYVGDVAVVVMAGEFRHVKQLEDALTRVVTTEGYHKVLVNMTEVAFLTSIAVGVLMSSYIALRESDGRLMFCGIPARIKEVLLNPFSIMTSMLRPDIVDSCSEALEVLGHGQSS